MSQKIERACVCVCVCVRARVYWAPVAFVITNIMPQSLGQMSCLPVRNTMSPTPIQDTPLPLQIPPIAFFIHVYIHTYIYVYEYTKHDIQ